MREVDNYKPYKGFEDLRDYKLGKRLFVQFWNIQDMLFYIQKNKNYYKKWLPLQWEKAKEISGSYQYELFKNKRG